jgi:hypothetical protein
MVAKKQKAGAFWLRPLYFSYPGYLELSQITI